MSAQAEHAPSPADANGATLLEAASVSKVFGGLVAVNDISFTVPRKGIVSLIGPNGAGKTTCLNVVSGYLRPDAGDVRLRGRSVVGMSPTAYRRAWRTGAGTAGYVPTCVVMSWTRPREDSSFGEAGRNGAP